MAHVVDEGEDDDAGLRPSAEDVARKLGEEAISRGAGRVYDNRRQLI